MTLRPEVWPMSILRRCHLHLILIRPSHAVVDGQSHRYTRSYNQELSPIARGIHYDHLYLHPRLQLVSTMRLIPPTTPFLLVRSLQLLHPSVPDHRAYLRWRPYPIRLMPRKRRRELPNLKQPLIVKIKTRRESEENSLLIREEEAVTETIGRDGVFVEQNDGAT